MLPLFVQADEEERTVSAAKAATGAARNLISNFSVQSFGPTMPIFRYRLGLNDPDLRGTAAGDHEHDEDSEDEFVTCSFSVTPTVANIDNQITPILTEGHIRLMILGVEWFDELELTAKGVTFTVDNMDITSTERVPRLPMYPRASMALGTRSHPTLSARQNRAGSMTCLLGSAKTA